MSNDRDLSGFGVPGPGRKPLNSAAKPPSPPPRRRSVDRAESAPKERRKRINLSLPIPLAVALRAYTEEHQTFYLDVILRARALHRPIVMAGHRADDGGLPTLRRRQPSGRMQIALGVPPNVLVELDKDAADLGIDRSGYVAALLQQHLREPRQS